MAGDLDQLLTLHRTFFDEEGYPHDDAQARQALATLIDTPAFGHLLVCEIAGTITAYAVLTYGYSIEFHGRTALLDELYVSADARGCGLGRAALERVVQICRENGVRAVQLEVERENGVARELYSRAAFVDHHRHLMTKRLD